jgi:hypothetical protein
VFLLTGEWRTTCPPNGIADVVLADLERELVPFGAREELLGDGEGVVDQMLRHAVIGDDEEPGVFAGAAMARASGAPLPRRQRDTRRCRAPECGPGARARS